VTDDEALRGMVEELVSYATKRWPELYGRKGFGLWVGIWFEPGELKRRGRIGDVAESAGFGTQTICAQVLHRGTVAALERCLNAGVDVDKLIDHIVPDPPPEDGT
jgi:hypothetical protein